MENRGRALTELRRSSASGSHGKRSSDRYNRNRKAIEEETTMFDDLLYYDDLYMLDNDEDDWFDDDDYDEWYPFEYEDDE